MTPPDFNCEVRAKPGAEHRKARSGSNGTPDQGGRQGLAGPPPHSWQGPGTPFYSIMISLPPVSLTTASANEYASLQLGETSTTWTIAVLVLASAIIFI
jgi:hypothetical protein